ncbi:MAG: hypothetical protein IKS48_11375 [Eubacterium sp.]|nr:hypothetical protein [Eubacterium sp.]
MKRIKRLALGISIATLISLAAIPSFDKVPGIRGVISSQPGLENVKAANVKKWSYMAYQPEILDLNFNFKSSSNMKHLENESPDAFSDKYIKELAKKYGKYHKLKNCEYMAKAYGNGRGFGDYLFIKGFSYFEDNKGSDRPTNGKYVVKCDHQEFYEYFNEMDKYNTCIYHNYDPTKECVHYAKFVYDSGWRRDEYIITYDVGKHVLIEEQFIYENY